MPEIASVMKEIPKRRKEITEAIPAGAKLAGEAIVAVGCIAIIGYALLNPEDFKKKIDEFSERLKQPPKQEPFPILRDIGKAWRGEKSLANRILR